ncbi:MAG: hypothetical protein ACI81L_000327 [Verrucomicrobiales bacterium]|jgi:hypothetical protein
MALEVETKDCNALGDADISDMADLCADSPLPYEAGDLSKQAEEWVLCCQALDNGRLKGFAYYTLERIGGTPAIIIGLGSIGRNSRRDSVMRGMVTDLMHRAVMAFPDEDVVVGLRMQTSAGFEMLKSFNDVVPRPEHKTSGEERAWGRRFAKRFGISPLRYADRAFSSKGNGSIPCAFDHESTKPESVDPVVAAYFDDLDPSNGDVLIAFGWAMSEDLAKFA